MFLIEMIQQLLKSYQEGKYNSKLVHSFQVQKKSIKKTQLKYSCVLNTYYSNKAMDKTLTYEVPNWK